MMEAKQSGRTPAKTDLEILEACNAIQKSGREVTGTKLRTFFKGVGHVDTYKKALERLIACGAFNPDKEGGGDPLVNQLFKSSLAQANVMREFAYKEFQERVDGLIQEHSDALAQKDDEINKRDETIKSQASTLEAKDKQLKAAGFEITSLKEELAQLRELHAELQSKLMEASNRSTQLEERLNSTSAQRDHLLDQLTVLEDQEKSLLKRQSDDHARSLNAIRQEVIDLREELSVSTGEKTSLARQNATLATDLSHKDRELRNLEAKLQQALNDPEKNRLEGDNLRLYGEIERLQSTMQHLLEASQSGTPAVVISRTDTTITVFIGGKIMRYHCPDHEGCDASAFADFDTVGPVIIGDNLVFASSQVSLPLDDFEIVTL